MFLFFVYLNIHTHSLWIYSWEFSLHRCLTGYIIVLAHYRKTVQSIIWW